MQYVSSALGLIGGGVSIFGTLSSSRAEATAYKYNAMLNEANAKAIEQKYAEEERISRRKAQALTSEQRALYAKAGVDLSSGSPLLAMAETSSELERDAMMTRWEGQVQAAEQRNQATLNRFYAKQVIKAGKTQAWSQGLSSLTGSASNMSKTNWPKSTKTDWSGGGMFTKSTGYF